MKRPYYEYKIFALVPLIMVGILILCYGFFQAIFVECQTVLADCQAFNTENVAQVFPMGKTGPFNEEGDLIIDKEEESKRRIISERFGGRLMWVFFAAIGTLLCPAALFISFKLIRKSANFYFKFPWLIALLMIIIAILLGVGLYAIPDSFMPIMSRIFKETIAQGKFGMPGITSVMRLLNAFQYVAAISLIFASCAILMPRNRSSAKALHDTILTKNLNIISEQVANLHIVLYISTLLLIIGIFRMNSLAQWSLSFVSLEGVEAAKSYNSSMISVVGAFYTMILAAMYMPTVFILQKRAEQLVKDSNKSEDIQQEMLKSKGFTFSFLESLPRAVAILGPLLVGPIGDLFKAWPT